MSSSFRSGGDTRQSMAQVRASKMATRASKMPGTARASKMPGAPGVEGGGVKNKNAVTASGTPVWMDLLNVGDNVWYGTQEKGKKKGQKKRSPVVLSLIHI